MKSERGSGDNASIKNLDQIQEQEPQASSRVSALVMASFGGACIVFAALALMRSPASETQARPDPLGDLAARGDKGPSEPRQLGAGDVTFPQVLTDQENPTTAMAAVNGPRAEEGVEEGELPRADMLSGPPPPGDKLSVMPLPAQDVLDGARVKFAPGDTLRSMAAGLTREPEKGQLAEPGQPGGYQLQVSSFKEESEASGFVQVLRRRGHRAHVEKAQVQGRGLWHRVRIGPFKYRRSAEIYRQDFEAKERMVSFVVEPPKAEIKVGPPTDDDSP